MTITELKVIPARALNIHTGILCFLLGRGTGSGSVLRSLVFGHPSLIQLYMKLTNIRTCTCILHVQVHLVNCACTFILSLFKTVLCLSHLGQ